ncbi:hypothetical protein CTER_5107 [Ruminiclostridium cellobioparum subsp. termitidis CT1112]|uniref:Uncharacterized protein n=1 Tax=Ruminiclostridium cellobioparum subsp. termitidis CT1112 TaxID=1195236 RepID=S0FP93_RUMCE|nr:hypothetical protein CTER_5107 [Ruminiclostridium cellobioparum subsp. termitidis CT1112]
MVNTNPLIINALKDIGLPVESITYSGDESKYITFIDADNRATDYADDLDITESAIVQVHYFTSNNPKSKSKEIRKALRNAGFIYLSTSEFYEKEEKYYHIVIEVRYDDISETVKGDY